MYWVVTHFVLGSDPQFDWVMAHKVLGSRPHCIGK